MKHVLNHSQNAILWLFKNNALEQQNKARSTKISVIIFAFTLAVILLNVVSLLWPALITSLTSISGGIVEPFEPGEWAIAVLGANVGTFYFWYLYSKKTIPHFITKYIKFILDFEVSRKVAAIGITVLLAGYIGFVVEELGMNEIEQLIKGLKIALD